jgi:hypothetical protein
MRVFIMKNCLIWFIKCFFYIYWGDDLVFVLYSVDTQNMFVDLHVICNILCLLICICGTIPDPMGWTPFDHGVVLAFYWEFLHVHQRYCSLVFFFCCIRIPNVIFTEWVWRSSLSILWTSLRRTGIGSPLKV